MKRLQHVRTRRQLFRTTAIGAASIPFLALARNSASAQTAPSTVPLRKAHSCLLKGTNILVPSGECLVQDLQIGDEFRRLPVLRSLSGLATTNSQRMTAGVGRIA